MLDILLILIWILLILAVLVAFFGVLLLFSRDGGRMAGYKSAIKFCLGTLCSLLCLLWFVQLFWGGGWRLLHLLAFVLSAAVATWSFISLRRNKK